MPSPSSSTTISQRRPVRRELMRTRVMRVTNRVVEQVHAELAQTPLVAVDDRAGRRDCRAARCARRRAAAYRARRGVTIAAKSTGSHCSARGAGSRASVNKSVTTAEASSALRAIVSNEAATPIRRVRAGRLRDGCNCRQRRAQLVRGIGREAALALARRLERRDRGTRQKVRCDGDDDDERRVDFGDREGDVTHRRRQRAGSFGRAERRCEHRGVLARHKLIGADTKSGQDADEDAEVEGSRAGDQAFTR